MDGTRKIRTHIALVILLLLQVVCGSACRKSKAPPAGPAAKTSSESSAQVENAGNYGWTLDNGQRSKLADYQGKVVVIDFYATWCEPCRVETPHLVALQRQYGEQGLQVIGLNVGGEDDRDQVPTYAQEFGIQYPLAFPEDELVDAYLSDNENIPQVFVFDRSGKLIQHFVGFTEEGGQELERLEQDSLTAKGVSRQ